MTLVATRHRGCGICKLPDEVYHAVNYAIWGGAKERRRGYQNLAMAAAEDRGFPKAFNKYTPIRHADHIEREQRQASTTKPVSMDEDTVYATDYLSMADRAASLGVKAMVALESRLPDMDAKDQISLAKLGMGTRSQQEDRRLAARQMEINVMALFGVSSGHMADLPDSEIIDVTPVEELRDELERERKLLTAHAGR